MPFMWKGTWFRGACAVLLLAASAFGAAEERLEKAKALYAQAEPHANRADDPELEPDERKEARDAALKLLRQARDEFQAWQLANGENADDPVGKEIVSLLHWMRKMSGVGGGGGGGGGGSTPRTEPKPPVAPPAGGDKTPEPGGAGGGTATPPATPPAAPPDPVERVREAYRKLQDLEKTSLRSDLPALKEAYEKFLADTTDTTLPEYTKAAIRLGQIQEELNSVFKRVVKSDPDAYESETGATPKVLAKLTQEINSKDPETRRRAAKLLGATRSGAASWPLVKVIREDDEELVRIAKESLVAIGGTRAAENLAKQYRNAQAPAQNTALDVLEGIARKGSVDARTVGPVIGRFALSNDGATAKRALDFLVSLGYDGGPGLVAALETNVADKRLYVVNAIGQVKYLPATPQVFELVPVMRGGATDANPAYAALKQLGVGITPYVSRYLGKGGKLGIYAPWVLKQITGQNLGDNPRAWQKWWAENKPKSSGK